VRALVLYGGYAHFHSWVMGVEALATFTRQVENVEAPGRRDRDTNSSGHRRTIIRVVGPDTFGLFMNGGTNNPERMSS